MDINLNKIKRYNTFKRVNSFVGALFWLIVLSIFLIIIFLINIIDTKGHPFFKQERYGYQHKTFNIYKFRSMNKEGKSSLWGRFIRFTSIDELPQLINILKGDMVFIGPRPLSIKEGEINEVKEKSNPSPYIVRPGLSGYAQMHFDPKGSIEEKVNYDIYYVSNFSLSLDLKILFVTIFRFLPISIHHR